VKVLVSKKEGVYHFPTAEINPHDSWILMGLYRILKVSSYRPVSSPSTPCNLTYLAIISLAG
jgi:hypothetical protein